MKQIRVEVFGNRRRIEVGNGAVRVRDFNTRHGPESAAVIESGEMRQAVEALTFNQAAARCAVDPGNDSAGFRRSGDPRNRVDG